MPVSMSDQEVQQFAQYVVARCGIQLDLSKRYLLEGRLADVLTALRCRNYAELYARAQSGDKDVERRIIDAVTTNETFFFRDPKTFDLLKHKLIPEMLGDKPYNPLTIWSAACSTGQEAYSVAMVLDEILFDLSKCRAKIVGTDISEAAVNAANRGEFSSLEVSRGLSPGQITKHFRAVGDRYRIRDEARAICQFRVDNLLRPSTKGPFDVILCRNVLIYFASGDRSKVVANLFGRLRPGGALLVGATESLLGVSDKAKRVEFHGASYYVLAG
jgi:chemotaxis protein methyltransferase CheR